MDLEWDEAKRESSIEKHTFDFIDASAFFDGRRSLTVQSDYGGEARHLTTAVIEDVYWTAIWTARTAYVGSFPSGGQEMPSEERIVRYTIEELRTMQKRGESRTDWERARSMTDEEIEANVDFEDEGYFDFSKAQKGLPPFEEPIQISAEIVGRLEARGIDPTQRINEVMRQYVDSLPAEEADSRKAS